MEKFEDINRGYNSTFKPNKLSVGLVVPIENYSQNAVPTMHQHLELIQRIDQLGFKAAWLRDIPLYVPSFGDAGQTYDPFTYLGYLSGLTKDIALGVASIALPLHHPLHIAKSAATIDQLSNGRLILGVASGDRYDEYPAMGKAYETRGEQFKEAFNYIRKSQEHFPHIDSKYYGSINGNLDVLPKPKHHKIPMLMTGFSQQSLDWNAEFANGWMSYPKDLKNQRETITNWRNIVKDVSSYNKPFMQPLYIDLQNDNAYKPQPIHLGFRLGIDSLIEYLYNLQDIGVNHIALNLRFNTMGVNKTLDILANKVLPHFSTEQHSKAII